ncbi:MAG: hypothetical protein V3T17_14010 [Pseudomonadales bacterium]
MARRTQEQWRHLNNREPRAPLFMPGKPVGSSLTQASIDGDQPDLSQTYDMNRENLLILKWENSFLL